MTKLWILSDLHLSHNWVRPEPPAGAEIAVIAGDIVDDGFLADIAARLPTVFIAGNHEFDGHEIGERKATLAKIPHLYFLDNDIAIIAGVRFIGSTLWTDYDRGNPASMEAAARHLSDHHLIRYRASGGAKPTLFTPEHALALHNWALAFLDDAFRIPSAAPTVIVTHHAPSRQSIHARFADAGAINHAFVSNLDYCVRAFGADLWVHGHVHNNFDYRVGQTRVVCNPRGYPGENSEFDPALVVEVSNG